ncbi:MAG: hypothetical protein ACI4PC_06855 [Oscillospiraceae bacterium]
MYLSLNIYLEALRGYEIESHNVDGHRKFLKPYLLWEEREELTGDELYVCPLSTALRLVKKYPDCTFVALRDRFRTKDEAENSLSIVVVNDDLSLINLYMLLAEKKDKMCLWQERLQRAIIEERPLGELLVASEDILENFISVSDSTLSLIAYTPHIPIDDPVTCRLIEKGYHDDETIDVFRKGNRFQRWQEDDGLILDLNHATSPKYDVVSRVFRYVGAYYTHVVMVCNRAPVSDALVDKFNLFTDHMAVYLAKINEHARQKGENETFYIIERILDSAEVGSDLVAESVYKLKLAGKKRFWLLCLSHELNGIPAGVIAHEVQSLLPEAKVAVYRQTLLVLLSSAEESECVLEESLEVLIPALREKKFCCSVSNAFDSLNEMKNAYQQVTVAMNYGKRLMNVKTQEEFRGPIFRYESFYVFILLSEPNNSAFLMESRAYKVLNDIRETDLLRNTNNFQLLYHYLTQRCHAGNTSKIMYMSRNNVAYRIQQLVDKYGLELDDYLVQMGLLLTYEMMWLNPSL